MKVYLKLQFATKHEYYFNGDVNNSATENKASSVVELNESKTVLLTPGYETVGGWKKRKEGLSHPFNELYFKINFQKADKSFWSISCGVDNFESTKGFEAELEGDRLTLFGEIVLRCDVKDACFADLEINKEKILISECSLKKILSDGYNDHKTFRFTYTGQWELDEEVQSGILQKEDNNGRLINLEYAKSMKKAWL